MNIKILKIGQENGFYYIHHLKNSQLGINATWNDAYCQLHDEISKIKSIFDHKMSYPNIEKKRWFNWFQIKSIASN